MSRVGFTEAIRTKTVQNVLTAMRRISLNCLQIACSLVLGISRQTLQGRCAIFYGKQYPKKFSSGFWIALHWIKTAKPLRETKVYVNADLSYLSLTALEVVPILYEIFM